MNPDRADGQAETDILGTVVWHGVAWLLIANLVGLLLATLLLFPGLNHWLGELTYGRWMPVPAQHAGPRDLQQIHPFAIYRVQ